MDIVGCPESFPPLAPAHAQSPPTLPMDRWTGPLPGFLTMHPIALVVFLLLVVLAVMLPALWL